MYISILILPFLGSLFSGLLGRKIGVTGAHLITCTCLILSSILATVAFYEVGICGSPVSIFLVNWIDSEFMTVTWEFLFDQLTVYFLALYLWLPLVRGSEEIGAVLVLIQLYKMFIKIKFILFVKRLSSLFVCKTQFNIIATAATAATAEERPLFTYSKFVASALPTLSSNKRFYSTSFCENRQKSLNEQSSIDSPYLTLTCGSATDNFLEWFVGFTDAEGCFIINPFYKKNKLSISSFVFMFKITLHKDDEKILRIIKDRLRIGGVRIYKDECIFTVTKEKDIAILISIFDKFNLNTSKYLDYLDFKEAFFLYFNREPNFNPDSIKDSILGFKNNMNSNRILFDRPENSKIVITKTWLLGFIEGDGSFFLRRDNLTPVFSLVNTAVQLPLLLKIKEFLEASLGFDTFSLYKVKNTNTIAIASIKARTINSKSCVSITIQNINLLNNYLIPFFENEEFLTKKGKDFYDFKIMCKVIYGGGHRIDKIKALILKLSNTMNNFRLSTFNGVVQSLTQEELDFLACEAAATPTVIRLPDGRVIDSKSKKLLPKLVCCVYEILGENGSFILANSLSEAANIVGLYPDTLSKYLDFNAEQASDSTEEKTRHDCSAKQNGGFVKIKKYSIRRVRVFTGPINNRAT